MKKIVLLCAMTCISVCALCQTTLQVTLTHIVGQKGDIIVGVFDSDENFLKKPIERKVMQPSGDSITVVFENLKPGKYAVCVIHDANKNKELDKNKLGIPKEGFGFSNNVLGAMGPPTFERAQFDLTSDQKGLDIDIKMKYM
ncbi:MAG TPA: DUF2141 domain-containing protein [Chryseolinea sp.]|jgi:uncharacterized protein (DUF2141 family)|nr:DUF2141 domain-containing protein [Chryseolinea sp.]